MTKQHSLNIPAVLYARARQAAGETERLSPEDVMLRLLDENLPPLVNEAIAEEPSTRPVPVDPDRLWRAAFGITAAWEGGGYASYQNRDKGIVSYGRFQFTLASGNLMKVLERYLAGATGSTAQALRDCMSRVANRDAGLRRDEEFERLLKQAAQEPAMQQAQDAVAKEAFWDRIQALSILPRNIQTPLGQALVFDMGINHGIYHDMLNLAEDALGVPHKSRMPDNGASEPALIGKLAHIRLDRMRRLAEKLDAPGLIPRGEFWVEMVERGDWHLVGDAEGTIEVKPGLAVQVRTP